MYKYIINPKTKRKVSIKTKKGLYILDKYLKKTTGGTIKIVNLIQQVKDKNNDDKNKINPVNIEGGDLNVSNGTTKSIEEIRNKVRIYHNLIEKSNSDSNKFEEVSQILTELINETNLLIEKSNSDSNNLKKVFQIFTELINETYFTYEQLLLHLSKILKYHNYQEIYDYVSRILVIVLNRTSSLVNNKNEAQLSLNVANKLKKKKYCCDQINLYISILRKVSSDRGWNLTLNNR